ncbi:NAD(P)H-quinone oxidoreductase subunit L, chloroplastic [Magnolia sinica]|uniref:NAD(P)H-quinone oxidoreductase subunit L, chloroplastic n=1 Tax=Magnolia sinica TaxID=86752 RepID=UPI0026590622|nr:NAD(P)H-quinone oxidoreductase subunit L, chloroplastic [Magnolia sinica]
MSCSWSILSLPPPFFSSPHRRASSRTVDSKWIQSSKCYKTSKASIKAMIKRPFNNYIPLEKPSLVLQLGLLLASVELPAFAVTGVNDEEDLISTLIQLGIVAFWYFLIMPPVIMNWLRLRWYKRKLLEMYLQFMCVFMFFPGLLLWAPFLNFRRFPRDPNMKYPWSTPQDPSINDPKSL